MPDINGIEPLVQRSPHHIEYQNQIFSAFISGLGDYIRNDLFPRAKDTVISTHSKAVEMVRNRKNLAGENWSPKFPFLVVSPSMNFLPDQLVGKSMHNYPNYNVGLGARLYNPRIYEDDDLFIAINLNRFSDTMDITCWCSSIYEVIDVRMRIIQMFGGIGRYIQPRNIDCMILLPEYLENYTYTNRYTEESKTLDWTGNPYTESMLIRNINQEKLTYTVTLRPMIRLNSIDDQSDSWGGGGNMLSDHKVSINLEWETNIPTHLTLVERKMPRPSVPITFEMAHNFRYIANPLDNDVMIKVLDDISSVAVTQIDSTSRTVEKKTLTYLSSENYIVSSSDVSSFQNNENVRITPGVSIPDSRYIRVHGKYGYLNEPIHYDVDTSSGEIKLYGQNMKNLVENDILTMIYYE